MLKLKNILTLTILSLVFGTATAHAIPLEIIASPTHTGRGFNHNFFHESVNGGSTGNDLAWFDLDTSKVNTFDPDSGNLLAHFHLYTNHTLDPHIGSVKATGVVPASEFVARDGSADAYIDWTFSITDPFSPIADYLKSTDSTVRIFYADTVFTTTHFGDEVNSWTKPRLSLWGSGTFDCNGGNGGIITLSVTECYLGSDIVLQTGNAVPEPASMILFSSGLIGFGLRRKFT